MIVIYDRQNIFIVQVTRVCFFTRAIVFRGRQEPIRAEHFTVPPLIVTLRLFANIRLILITAAVTERDFLSIDTSMTVETDLGVAATLAVWAPLRSLTFVGLSAAGL